MTAEPGGRSTAEDRHDVIVVGDGPAGSALARALTDRGVDVVVLGSDDPWRATYGVWSDELEMTEVARSQPSGARELMTTCVDGVRVAGVEERDVPRAYAVVDNGALRAALRSGVAHVEATVNGVEACGRDVRATDAAGRSWSGRLVMDATGWPSRLTGSEAATPMAWQTAWGVVLSEPPEGPLGRPTVMDWSAPGGVDHDVPTFAYALPVADGWLIEETVLASRAFEPPERLRPVLARRLGWTVEQLDERALRAERVGIPMGAPVPPGRDPRDGRREPVPYGAAAALAHPATGYQLVPALALAGQVADAIARSLSAEINGSALEAAALDHIWTPSRRRTRALHEFGLDVLLRLDADGLRSFFDTFFSLPDGAWSPQMRIDSSPGEISAVMLRMFAAAPWSLRRRLAGGDPRVAWPLVSSSWPPVRVRSTRARSGSAADPRAG